MDKNNNNQEKYFEQDPQIIRAQQQEKAQERRIWINYLVAVAIGAVITVLAFFALGLFAATETIDIIRKVCDGFIVSGFLVVGAGGLVWLSNEGAFDMIKYGVSSAFTTKFSDPKHRKFKDFYEYREARSKNKAKFIHLLIVGASYFFIGLVFFVVYKIMV
jgi:hypothetical protein